MQYKVYDLLLALPQDPQAASALCVINLFVALFCLLVYLAGAKCTTCVEDRTPRPVRCSPLGSSLSSQGS
ncbi:Claudin-6 [Manis javanica]|nr:Claudin-6 [Manis javanica]